MERGQSFKVLFNKFDFSSAYNTIATPTVLLKSDWLAPYFRGRCYYGLHHVLEKKSPLFYNFDAFLKEFAATFGEVDRERVANTKIRSLRQGSRLASTYAAEFQQLACDVD